MQEAEECGVSGGTAGESRKVSRCAVCNETYARVVAENRLAQCVKECVQLALILCANPVWCKNGSERTAGVVGSRTEPIGIGGGVNKEGRKRERRWEEAGDGRERN